MFLVLIVKEPGLVREAEMFVPPVMVGE